MTITDTDRQLGPACRHFRPRETITEGQACAIGHPICKIVKAANRGSLTGTAYMYPCRPGPLKKADCPSYDPKTEAEIAAEREELSKRMDAFVKALPAMSAIRATMVEGKIARQTFDCPWCNAEGKLHVTCAIGVNNHLWVKCAACGEGFIE